MILRHIGSRMSVMSKLRTRPAPRDIQTEKCKALRAARSAFAACAHLVSWWVCVRERGIGNGPTIRWWIEICVCHGRLRRRGVSLEAVACASMLVCSSFQGGYCCFHTQVFKLQDTSFVDIVETQHLIFPTCLMNQHERRASCFIRCQLQRYIFTIHCHVLILGQMQAKSHEYMHICGRHRHI